MADPFPFSAEVNEALAWRIVLAEYIEENLRYKTPKGPSRIKVIAFPFERSEEAIFPSITFIENTEGEWNASSLTPKPVDGTKWPTSSPKYALTKDAEYVEETSIVIKATEVMEAGAIALALYPVMNPHTSKFGSLRLDLGKRYFGRMARFTVKGS